jgi:hypothetical protein
MYSSADSTILAVLWSAHRRTSQHITETPDNIRLAAHQRNIAAENNLPMTFVDHAEEVWELLADEDVTQQMVADGKGWSRGKVSNFVALENISPSAWEQIATEFAKSVAMQRNDSVASSATNVAITEGLLRNILDLTETHQKQIIDGLISAKLKTSQVKKRSQEYRDRETFALYAIESLICYWERGAGFLFHLNWFV